MDREQLTSILESGVHMVRFTKVDGTDRTMPCTLDPMLLPVQQIKEGKQEPKINLDTLRVYVTDIAQWRSFRVKNVLEVSPAQ